VKSGSDIDRRIFPLLGMSIVLMLVALGITAWSAGGPSGGPATGGSSSSGDQSATTAPTGSGSSTTPGPPAADCGPAMAAPAGWSVAQRTFDDTFSEPLLDHWNYGLTDFNTNNGDTQRDVWAQTGAAPYFGSSTAKAGGTAGGDFADDYDTPGDVFQTTTGVDEALVNGYTPQTFRASGCGVSFVNQYTGPVTRVTQGAQGTFTTDWTGGAINSYGKVAFPTGANTSFYVQIRAQMAGLPGNDNGAWSALWLLGQGNEQREIDGQESGVDGGTSPDLLNSHLQTPAVSIQSDDTGIDLSQSYNTYGIELSGGVVTIYFNGAPVGQAASGTTGPYFLLMNSAVFAPGGSFGQPPTSQSNMQMNVAEVQVYQR
jgi:hypothetical protein